MDWPTTIAITAAALVATGLFGWLGARPPNLAKGPRLVPWRFLMALAAVVVVLMLAHMANLAGMTTGRR